MPLLRLRPGRRPALLPGAPAAPPAPIVAAPARSAPPTAPALAPAASPAPAPARTTPAPSTPDTTLTGSDQAATPKLPPARHVIVLTLGPATYATLFGATS